MIKRTNKICISGPTDRPWVQDELRAAGCEVVLGRSIEDFPDHLYDEGSLIGLIGDSDMLLVSTRERVTGGVLEGCKNLRAVVKASIGVENVDIEKATELGVLVCNSPAPENFIGLAEATVGLILALIKRLKLNEEDIRHGGWKKEANTGDLIFGKTVGLVGMGRVAKEVAKRFQGWGVKVIAYDPYVSGGEAAALQVAMVPLETLLQQSDVVSVHVVLNAETRHIIGRRELRLMKPSAFLVNTSRGGAIDQKELVAALSENVIAGAAVDVFEKEPLPMDDPLRSLDPARLILTPHIIGNSLISRDRGHQMAIQTILQLLRGEVPAAVLNPQAAPRWRRRFVNPEGTGDRG